MAEDANWRSKDSQVLGVVERDTLSTEDFSQIKRKRKRRRKAGPINYTENLYLDWLPPNLKECLNSTLTYTTKKYEKIKKFVYIKLGMKEPDRGDLPRKTATATETDKERVAYFARLHVQNFASIKWLLILTGKFPFATQKLVNGTYRYVWNLRHPNFIWFVIANLIQFGLQFIAMYNVMTIINNQYLDHFSIPTIEVYGNLFERVLLRRYGMFMYVFWTAVTVGNLCTVVMLIRWRLSANVYTIMNRAIAFGHFSPYQEVYREVNRSSAAYFVMVFITGIIAATGVGISAPRVPILMSITIFRGVLPTGWFIHRHSSMYGTFFVIGGLLIILLYTSALVWVALLMYQQKLLFNILRQWVIRLAVYIDHPIAKEEPDPEDKILEIEYNPDKVRVTREFLTADHRQLLDSLQCACEWFAVKIELFLFISAQTPMMMLYMFVQDRRSNNQITEEYAGDHFIRPNDWIVHFILMVGHLFIVFYLLIIGNRYTLLSEEAYDVSVFKNLNGRSTDEELFFHQTLNYSFNAFRTIEIRGIGVFNMSRLTTGALAGLIFSYFFVLNQLSPALEIYWGDERSLRDIVGIFLSIFEDLEMHSWHKANPLVENRKKDELKSWQEFKKANLRHNKMRLSAYLKGEIT